MTRNTQAKPPFAKQRCFCHPENHVISFHILAGRSTGALEHAGMPASATNSPSCRASVAHPYTGKHIMKACVRKGEPCQRRPGPKGGKLPIGHRGGIIQKNPRAHKNKIGTPPPPPPPKKKKNPKRGILRTWFFLQKERIFSRCP